MKKRFALFLSLVLSIGAALPAFAASNVELDEDTWEQISDVLQPDNYGGMYYGDDGQLHIKPIAHADVETMLFDNVSSRASRNIVIDEVAQYSVEELDEASMVLEEYMDEYGITYIALDNKNNGLAIGLTELSQETEDALRELSPVENVSFDLLETEEVAEIQETAVEEEETRASGDNLARSGSTII